MLFIIKFLVIIFDEKIHDAKFFSFVIFILNFTTFVVVFVDNVMKCCIKFMAYIGFYFAKADENFWREGQGSERTDLKTNGFFIAYLNLKCSN